MRFWCHMSFKNAVNANAVKSRQNSGPTGMEYAYLHLAKLDRTIQTVPGIQLYALRYTLTPSGYRQMFWFTVLCKNAADNVRATQMNTYYKNVRLYLKINVKKSKG